MAFLYLFTHRRVFTSFNAGEVDAVTAKLKKQGIKPLVKMHSSNRMIGTIGQLAQYQVSYDVYVKNDQYEEAQFALSS